MAYEGPQINQTFVAGSGGVSQYKFVKLSANNTVVAMAAVTDVPVGIAQNAAAAGASVNVALAGVSKVVGEDNLAAGETVGSADGGEADAYANGTDTTKYIVGHVLEDNSATGGIATIAFSCLTPNRGA